MATYRPSFVDVSGLSQGIGRGLEIAAQQKRQEDALAEARVDDFMKMYQPGKLMQNHIPEFTNAYNNYKQSALQYSKLNRGGGKPEELALAKTNMDNALSGLNNVYTTSVKTAEKMSETADVLKAARAKGLSIPPELSQTYNMLSSSPVSELSRTIDKIPSAYSYRLLSEDVDYTKVFKDLDLIGAKAKQTTQFVENPNSGYTFMGAPLKSRTKLTIESRNPLAIMKGLPTLLADPTHNGLKIQIDNQYEAFKNSDPETKSEMAEVLRPIFGINTAEDITPSMIGAYNLASSNISKQEDDPTYIRMQVDEIKQRSNISEKAKDRAASSARAEQKLDINVPSHPYNAIQTIKSSATGGLPYDATDILNAYNLPGMLGGKEMIRSATYDPNADKFSVRTISGNELSLTPYALENQIVETSGEYKARKVPTGGKPKAGGLKYKGLDSKGNPIYE